MSSKPRDYRHPALGLVLAAALMAIVVIVGCVVGGTVTLSPSGEAGIRDAIYRAMMGLDPVPDAGAAEFEWPPYHNYYFNEKDHSVVCGNGHYAMCLKIVNPGVYEMPGSRPVTPTAQDKYLCRDYYQYFIRTGQSDAYVDDYCYQRWLTPVMVPDPSR